VPSGGAGWNPLVIGNQFALPGLSRSYNVVGFFEKYGIPPLDDEAIARVEAEWRGETPKKKRRRVA